MAGTPEFTDFCSAVQKSVLETNPVLATSYNGGFQATRLTAAQKNLKVFSYLCCISVKPCVV